MKTNTLRFTILWVASLALSCKEKQEIDPPILRDTVDYPVQSPEKQPNTSATLQITDTKYGKLDMEGFPIDPGLGMNSDKISKEQRSELRQPLPEGYHIGQPIVPRILTGKSDDVEWRKVGIGSFNSVSNDVLSKLLGLDPAQIPQGIRDANRVLKSPSGGRVIVQMGGSDLLFESKNRIIDVSSSQKIHCVNFDDKRRAFIIWESFMSESLIVGYLADDEDIEDLPSRQILYTYDIDKMILRRVTFPKNVQEEEWKGFVVDSVAPSAVLLRWDGREDPMTVYLD